MSAKAEVIRRSPYTASRTIGKKALIINLTANKAYTLNPAGTVVWEKINCRNSEREIAEKLASMFDAPKAAVAKDVRGFLRELRREGLVQGASGVLQAKAK